MGWKRYSRHKELAFWDIPIQQASGCWLWPTGYEYGKYAGEKAHRIAFQLAKGPIPPGLELDHRCRTPLCVNPDHLEPVTHLENMRRARKEHCPKGHPYTPQTRTRTLQSGKAFRVCEPCRIARDKRRWQRSKQRS